MKKKLISALLVTCMLVSLTACGKKGNEVSENTSGEPKEDEVITLTAFFKKELPWDTAVAEEITKRTGVKLEYISVAGDPNEKLNVMLASDSIPDIVTIDRGAAANAQYIKNKKVIPLDDLILSHGGDVDKQLGSTKVKIKDPNDGKLYGIPSWFQDDITPSPVFGFSIRMNYVKELGYYDTYVDKGYFTQTEFFNLLKDWKAKYPEINGKKSIAMAFNSENEGDYTWPFRGMYGITSSYDKDGVLYNQLRNPKSKEMYLFMNQLYREELIDKDWPLTKQALYDEKISNGYVLSSPAAYWNIKNHQLKTDKDGNVNIDNQMFPFLVAADGLKPEDTTYGPSSVLGWANTYISSTNKYPEKTMEFINFLISEEGQILTQWGIEGVHWKEENGKRVVLEEVAKELESGNTTPYFEKTGIRQYEILFKSGISANGQNYDLQTAYNDDMNKVDEVTLFAREYLGKTAYDTTKYDSLDPDSGTPEALINTKITDLQKTAMPKIIMAPTAEEAEAVFDKLIADCDKAGMEQVEAVSNKKFAARMKIWGE